MTFNTPAFVRVEDAEKRKELIEWLKDIGYEEDANSADVNDSRTRIVTVSMIESGFYHGNIYLAHHWVDINRGIYKYFTDCDTNIDLFKALAAMNDKNDREQWFVSYGGRFHKTSHKYWCNDEMMMGAWRKATAQEIIEYFKTKQL